MRINKGFILTVLAFLVALAVCFLSFIFLKEIYQAKEDIKSKNEKLLDLRSKEDDLKKAGLTLGKLEKGIEVVSTSLPKDPEIPLFMTQVEVVARESGLDIERLYFVKSENQAPGVTGNQLDKESGVKSPSGLAKTNSALKVEVVGSFTGSPNSIKVFFSNLEKSRRITYVSGIKVLEKVSKDTSNLSSLSASFTAFYSPLDDSKLVLSNPETKKLDDYADVIGKISSFRFYPLTGSSVVPENEEDEL